MQLTFGDAEGLGQRQRKQTYPGLSFNEMDKAVRWKLLWR